MTKKLKFGITIKDLETIIQLLDIVWHDRWLRDVPIIPGKEPQDDR